MVKRTRKPHHCRATPLHWLSADCSALTRCSSSTSRAWFFVRANNAMPSPCGESPAPALEVGIGLRRDNLASNTREDAANSVCSLPRLRGRGGEGVDCRVFVHAPSLTLQPKSDLSNFGQLRYGRTRVNPSSAASGGGDAPSAGREHSVCGISACGECSEPEAALARCKAVPTGAAAHGASERAACGGAGGVRGLECRGAPPPPRLLGRRAKLRRALLLALLARRLAARPRRARAKSRSGSAARPRAGAW